MMTTMRLHNSVLCLLGIMLCTNVLAAPNQVPLKHAISLYGEPRYGTDFTHFDYANPDAPKGGALKQGVLGHFDSLVPYVDRGTAAVGSHLMYDTLLARSWDEPLTKYGWIAEKIELDPENNWVAFHVNPKARFHDGQPVTAKDVKFSFDLLREKGSAFYKHFYREVEKVEVTDTYRALFIFNSNQNRELPLILGQMPILPEHYWKERDFSSPGLSVPVTSGPYIATKIDAGRTIIYERVKDYWAKDLPVMKGRHNFDQMQFDYYRERSVLVEAMRKGAFDLETIANPKTWNELLEDIRKQNDKLDQANGKNQKQPGLMSETIKNHNPQTLTVTFNLRRPLLQDIRIRQMVGYGIDFDWINKHQFYGMYHRATSFFAGTSMAASGLPSAAEKKLLTPWQNHLPEELFQRPWISPGSELDLSPRERQRKALQLLKDAGWKIEKNQQVNAQGQPLELEVLTSDANMERLLLPVQKQLESFGVKLNIRTVDTAQYIERVRNQDFDIILHTFPHTPSPGTEQSNFWGSVVADQHGTRNVTGVKLPVLDFLTAKIPEAQSREELNTILRAMDRVLLWNYVSLPLWYMQDWSIIHKDSLRHPENPAPYALDLTTWWYEEE